MGVCPQVSKRAGRDRSAECCCQDKAIQDDSEKHAQVFAWQFGSFCKSAIKEVEKQMRATLFQMYADYNCTSDKFLAELPIFLGWLDMLRGRSHGVRSKLTVKRHFSS